MRLDHVILACPSGLDAAAEWLQRKHALPTLAGGAHPRWGTANRILPLGGGGYLELVAVVDWAVAARTAFGRLIVNALEEATDDARPVPAGWCVAAPDLDAHAAKLGLAPVPASRSRPDGTTLRWRLAGVDAAAHAPYLPFFIEWQIEPDQHPGRAAYPGPDVRLVELRVSGDEKHLAEWLDGGLDFVTVVVQPGPPAVRACVIEVDGRTIVL